MLNEYDKSQVLILNFDHFHARTSVGIVVDFDIEQTSQVSVAFKDNSTPFSEESGDITYITTMSEVNDALLLFFQQYFPILLW